MTAEQAIHAFWSSFGLTAYDENSVPETAQLPYITYSVSYDTFGNNVALSGSIWQKSTSWLLVTQKAKAISEYIGDGGVTCNGTSTSRYYALCQIPIFLDIAKYHISGCPAGGSSGTYRVDVRNSEGQQITLSIDTGSGFDISVNNAGTYYYTIRIQTGYSVDNKIFTPKIEKIETVIASVGDFVSSGEHAGEYLIPVTINSSTTDIYLSEPLAKSDYIDYKTQKRYNIDGTSEDVTLPGITVPAGTDTLSVGTTVQPSVVKINYKKG